MSIHICSFASAVSDLKPKQKRDPIMVLRCLERNPRVSTWEMGEHNLYLTINELKRRGWITELDEPYPWHRFGITEGGQHEGGRHETQ